MATGAPLRMVNNAPVSRIETVGSHRGTGIKVERLARRGHTMGKIMRNLS